MAKKMILHTVLSELENILSGSAALIDLYKSKENTFFDKTVVWIERLEKFAADNKWAFNSSLAGLRGRLVTASRTRREDRFDWMPRSNNNRRAREALAAETVKIAVELATAYVSTDRALHDEASNLLRQLLAEAALKGIVSLKPTNGNGNHVAKVWAAMAANPEFGQACAHAVGLVGAYNVYILLDKCLNEILINGNGAK
ncbi:MAG: hypothetical protein FWE82_03650 [Defluviitaleaceae bacterium]|nr:hypothetical protein [Defluviitaleaceae bacterium]